MNDGGGYFEIGPGGDPFVDVKALYDHSKKPAVIVCRPFLLMNHLELFY